MTIGADHGPHGVSAARAMIWSDIPMCVYTTTYRLRPTQERDGVIVAQAAGQVAGLAEIGDPSAVAVEPPGVEIAEGIRRDPRDEHLLVGQPGTPLPLVGAVDEEVVPLAQGGRPEAQPATPREVGVGDPLLLDLPSLRFVERVGHDAEPLGDLAESEDAVACSLDLDQEEEELAADASRRPGARTSRGRRRG